MSLRKTAVACALLAGAAAAACSPIVRRHGYVPEKVNLSEITPDEDTRASIMDRYGSPSTQGVFEQDTWYYITNVRQQLGYLRPESAARSVVAVRFDDEGVVAAVDTYDLQDGKVVNFVSRESPTRGRELSILEQLLGNVGRLPSETLNQDNLPGGAGGPRR